MKTKNFKRPIALFLAVMLCASLLFSLGTTAFAAEETANVCLIAFPRDGDANYGGEWGHGNLNFMNGWSTKASSFTLIRAMGQYSGNICYCIEPGVSQQPGDSLTKKGEDFWDNYPAAYNKTISPEDIKLLIGRIFQYGYTGPISVSWRSQNDGGDKLAHAVATQLLIWETVVGERDADFTKIGTNGKDAIVDQISTNHPLYDQIMGYYSSIAANVQYHSSIPSFLAKTAAEAQSASLEWDGDAYAVTLTDKNGVLSDYSFSSPNPDIKFSVKGNELTISTGNMLNEPVAITAEKNNSRRSGVITWTDGVYGPNGKLQDTVTYTTSKAWVQFDLDARYANASILRYLPAGYKKVPPNPESNTYTIRKENSRFNWNIHSDLNQRMQDLSNYHRKVRKDLFYIYGDTKLWYLKKDLPNNTHVLQRNSLTLIFAVMHWMSELVRYNPQKFEKLIESTKSSALIRYLALANMRSWRCLRPSPIPSRASSIITSPVQSRRRTLMLISPDARHFLFTTPALRRNTATG